jgi:hypothetical protein
MSRSHRLLAGVHQQKTARTISILRHPRAQADLAESGCLLVAGQSSQRNVGAQPAGVDPVDHAAAIDDAGQQRHGNIEPGQQFLIPAPTVNVVQQGARRIRRVGDMSPSASQFPGQPAVDRAEGQFALFGSCPGAGDMVEQPLQLGSREIRIKQ